MNRNLWRQSFANELDKQERRQASNIRRYLSTSYNTAIDQAVESGGIQPLDSLFEIHEIRKLYIDLYRTVGVNFAKWYETAYNKLIKKSTGNTTTWATAFAEVGEREAGRKVKIVQGTAKDNLRKILGQLFKDEDFQNQGKIVQSRILRNRFNEISAYQAERIARTETTNAANQGVLRGATDLFGKNNLQKEWIANNDPRTRDSHISIDGTIVDYNEPFKVPSAFGVDLMNHPADPAGSAANVINCRCSIAVIPKEDAEIREGVELEGFGGALSARTTQLIGDELVSAAKPAKEVVEEVAESVSAEDVSVSLLNKAKEEGYNIGDISYTKLLKDPVELKFHDKGSFHNNGIIKINRKRYKKGDEMVNSVLAHEYGHAIHNQQGWAVYNVFSKRNPTIHPIAKKYFDKWRKQLGMGRRFENQKPIIDKMNQRGLNLDWEFFQKMKRDFPNLSETHIKEYHASMADFFGAITKNKIGYGHSNSYYTKRGVYGQYAEMLANSFDNYYFKN